MTNLVPSHHSDRVATENIPQSDGSICRSGGYVVGIWMELNTLELVKINKVKSTVISDVNFLFISLTDFD